MELEFHTFGVGGVRTVRFFMSQPDTHLAFVDGEETWKIIKATLRLRDIGIIRYRRLCIWNEKYYKEVLQPFWQEKEIKMGLLG